MCFIPGLIYDIKSIFVCKLQIAVHRRIVGSPDSIEAELLEDLHILADHLFGDIMSRHRMLHMRALCIDFQRHPIEVEDSVDDFGLLETDALCHLVYNISRIIRKGEGHIIKCRCLRCPFFRRSYNGAELHGISVVRPELERICCHHSHLPTIPADLSTNPIILIFRIIAPYIHGYIQF